jgi:branched-chain amino acid transport system substrate-binding protein
MTAGIALSLGLALSSVAKADITIAVAGPITGSNAALGDQIVAGAKQAVAEINASGGVLGQQLVLEIGDDACDPKQAVSVAEQLAAKKVVFVAGHVCSSSSIPASAVYSDAGIIQISPASTNPKYTDERPGPGTFRVCGRDDQQGAVAGAFLVKTFPGKNIAIVDDKSTYGKGLADETRKFFNQAGGKEVMNEAYNAGDKDFTALVSKLKAANVDVLYVGGYYTEAGLLARQMKDQGMKTILVSGDALVTDDYWKVAGDAGEGTLMTFSPDPRKDPANAALVETFRKANVEPEGYVIYTYAAVQVWAQAVAAAGSTDFAKVADAITKGTAKTALGDLTFDAKGDPKAPGYVVYEWKAGKYDYLTQ